MQAWKTGTAEAGNTPSSRAGWELLHRFSLPLVALDTLVVCLVSHESGHTIAACLSGGHTRNSPFPPEKPFGQLRDPTPRVGYQTLGSGLHRAFPEGIIMNGLSKFTIYGLLSGTI